MHHGSINSLNMGKKLLSALLLFIHVAVFAQDNQINVNSKIAGVTVFMNGAQVLRQSDLVELPQGVSLLVFSGLSSNIETQSLQAKGEGSFTILSVTRQNNFLLEKKKSEQKLALEAKAQEKLADLPAHSKITDEVLLDKKRAVIEAALARARAKRTSV